MTSASPAVETAKYLVERDKEHGAIMWSTGDMIVIKSVSATLIDEVVSRIEDPEVPMWHNPDKDRDELNPNDPKYLRAMQVAERRRGVAAMDAMVMFGIELVNGVPESTKWLQKLQKMEKMGRIDLAVYDLDDPIDVEFLYKRYILSDGKLLNLISKESGIAAEDVERAERSFKSN